MQYQTLHIHIKQIYTTITMRRLLSLLLLATLSLSYVASQAQIIDHRGLVRPTRKFWDDGSAKAFDPHKLHGDIESIEVMTTRKLSGWDERKECVDYFEFNEFGDVTLWIGHDENSVEDFRLEAKYDSQGRMVKKNTWRYGTPCDTYEYTYEGNLLTEHIETVYSEDLMVYNIETFYDPTDESDNIFYIGYDEVVIAYSCITKCDKKTKHIYETIISKLNNCMLYHVFDNDGNLLKTECHYPNGYYYGDEMEYDKKGRVVKLRNYDDGEVVSTTKYSYKGSTSTIKTYDNDKRLIYHAVAKYDEHGNVVEYKEILDASQQAQMQHSVYKITYRK